jgi:hypothetical protein
MGKAVTEMLETAAMEAVTTEEAEIRVKRNRRQTLKIAGIFKNKKEKKNEQKLGVMPGPIFINYLESTITGLRNCTNDFLFTFTSAAFPCTGNCFLQPYHPSHR